MQPAQRIVFEIAMLGHAQRRLGMGDLQNGRRRSPQHQGMFAGNAPDGRIMWKNGRFSG